MLVMIIARSHLCAAIEELLGSMEQRNFITSLQEQYSILRVVTPIHQVVHKQFMVFKKSFCGAERRRKEAKSFKLK